MTHYLVQANKDNYKMSLCQISILCLLVDPPLNIVQMLTPLLQCADLFLALLHFHRHLQWLICVL